MVLVAITVQLRLVSTVMGISIVWRISAIRIVIRLACSMMRVLIMRGRSYVYCVPMAVIPVMEVYVRVV